MGSKTPNACVISLGDVTLCSITSIPFSAAAFFIASTCVNEFCSEELNKIILGEWIYMGTVVVGGVIEKNGKFLLVQEAKEKHWVCSCIC